jgi:hypothetical protein
VSTNQLGDVVLSTRINSFILGAVYESKSMEYAIGGGLLDMKLTNNVSFLAAMEKELGEWYTEESIFISHPPISVSPSEDKLYGNNDWKKDVKENLEYHFNPSKLPRTPIFIDGTVDSSNFLIKDTKTLKNWLRFTRDALAVEMESAGVFEGVRTVEKNYPFLAIRGISDIIGLKRHNDWTIYACHTAAAFSLAFIRLGLIKSSMVSAKELSGSTERHSTTDPSSGVQKSSSEPLILKPTAKFETNVSGGNVGKIINIENAGTIKID